MYKSKFTKIIRDNNKLFENKANFKLTDTLVNRALYPCGKFNNFHKVTLSPQMRLVWPMLNEIEKIMYYKEYFKQVFNLNLITSNLTISTLLLGNVFSIPSLDIITNHSLLHIPIFLSEFMLFNKSVKYMTQYATPEIKNKISTNYLKLLYAYKQIDQSNSNLTDIDDFKKIIIRLFPTYYKIKSNNSIKKIEAKMTLYMLEVYIITLNKYFLAK